MKKISLLCNFNGQKAPFDFYVGSPDPDRHPVQTQASWLAANRGGSVPPEVMEALSKIQELSVKNNVDFAELCYHAISVAIKTDA